LIKKLELTSLCQNLTDSVKFPMEKHGLSLVQTSYSKKNSVYSVIT